MKRHKPRPPTIASLLWQDEAVQAAPPPRQVHHRYVDPLDQIWITTAARIGLVIERAGDVFAATDGSGVLRVGTDDTLDPDDCMAQMIFHELCHALVEGSKSFTRPDWGLDNTGPRDVVREHACLRVQAALARTYGLAHLLAPTTDFRSYYDQIGPEPLGPTEDPAAQLARVAHARADQPPWAPHLRSALRATAAIQDVVAPFAQKADGDSPKADGDSPSRSPLPSLWPAAAQT